MSAKKKRTKQKEDPHPFKRLGFHYNPDGSGPDSLYLNLVEIDWKAGGELELTYRKTVKWPKGKTAEEAMVKHAEKFVKRLCKAFKKQKSYGTTKS